MKKLVLPLLLVLLLLAAVCAMANSPTTTPISAAAMVDDSTKITQAAPPFDVGSAAVAVAPFAGAATKPAAPMDITRTTTPTAAKMATTTTATDITGMTTSPPVALASSPPTIVAITANKLAAADRGSPWTFLDIRTGADTSATPIVACSSPPILAGSAVATEHEVAIADSPPRHEVAIARMDYGGRISS